MQWINLEDEWPQPDVVVLVCDSLNFFVSLGRLNAQESHNEEEAVFDLMFIDGVEGDSYVTHWMPLPAVPTI